jgi:hypothetical protein
VTKKLAVFVEGQTEQIFLERLIKEIAGEHNVYFALRNYGEHKIVNFKQIVQEGQEAKYFVLLYDCQGDGQVKSKIRDERESLEKADYSVIIGLRDLYPESFAALSALERNLRYGLPTKGIPIHIVIALTEVEAWFLQDSYHYTSISDLLDPATFKATFGFDPAVDSAEQVHHPSGLLAAIYASVGEEYLKSRASVQRTVNALDVDQLVLTTAAQIPKFHELVQHVDNFLDEGVAVEGV